MDEGTYVLDALRPPQAQQDEEQDANAEKVADGSDHMEKQDDVIDAHDVLLVYASCTRAALKPGKMSRWIREVLSIPGDVPSIERRQRIGITRTG